LVTTRTTGVDTPDTLLLRLNAQPIVLPTPSSGSYSIGRLAAGTYVVAVVAPANCVVSDGGQVSVTVMLRAVTSVSFDVTCSKPTRSEKIAFVDDQTSPFPERYLSLVNPDGTGAARLRAGASPSWSPDRTRLAFSTTKCSDDDFYYWYYYGPSCTGGIALLDPETGNVAAASNAYAYEPSWAPTGGALVIEGFGVRERNLKLHVLQLSSRNTSLLDIKGPDSNEQPVWSPDGTRIAFVCRWPITTDLCVVNADGSGLVRLTNDAAADLHPAWSPSGNTIAFARQSGELADPTTGQIVLIDVATRAITVLTGGTEPTWSPDGSRLAFAGVGGLFLIGADGTNLKRLTTGFHREPAWRP
jgi:TolB protein